MDNPNKVNDQAQPVKLRQIRKPGDLATLKKKMWRAVLSAEDILMSPRVSTDQQLRAVHALVQAGGAYMKLLEMGELEARLSELEKSLEKRKNGRAYA